MKVVILAGGLGTRLSEYTERIPKPMVEIAKIAKKIVNLLYFFIFSLLCYIYVTFIKITLQVCNINVN